jgi:hypothetical protein
MRYTALVVVPLERRQRNRTQSKGCIVLRIRVVEPQPTIFS